MQIQRLAFIASWLIAACILCVQSQSCKLNDAELLKQRRLNNLRSNIMAQLGLSDRQLRNTTDPTPSPEEEAVIETFQALRNASASLEKEREKKCHSEDFFAKPVTSFVGLMSPEDLVTNDIVRRQTDSGSGEDPFRNILSSYKIMFDFSLPENLAEISRADLLLYQLPSVGFIRDGDRKQYVEIRTVLESMGQRFVVEGKYIDVLDSDYQVFEITSAVKLWLAKGINGSVALEVTVYCYSSPDCSQPVNGRNPARVNFLYETDDTSKAPRIITTSKNPIEVEHQNRYRRLAEGPGAGFCVENQTICCLKPLTINFKEDLGFEFILQPPEFDANYCEGVCPEVSDILMTPQLFEFLRRLGEASPASSVEPCCAGNTYSPLEVLMKVDGILVIEELQQVIVNSCRCA